MLANDLHNTNFLAVICDQNGSEQKRIQVVLSDTKTYESFIDQLTKEDYVAFETTTNSFRFYEQVIRRVKKVFVINTHKFWANKKRKNKTDYKDALEIASRLRYYILFGDDESLFPTVYVPVKEVQELRSLLSTYGLVTKQKVMLKNRIRSLLVQQGLYMKKENIYTDVIKESILDSDITETAKYQIAILYNQIADTDKYIEQLKDKIMMKGAYFKHEIELLVSIKGVSVFIAIGMMTDIANIKRFATEKKFCSYLKSAPSIEESNETTKMGSVNKQSRKLAIPFINARDLPCLQFRHISW